MSPAFVEKLERVDILGRLSTLEFSIQRVKAKLGNDRRHATVHERGIC